MRRYERASPILTSIKSFLDWGEINSNQLPATSILDRLPRHVRNPNIKGGSNWLKKQRGLGIRAKALTPIEPEEVMNPA